MYLYINSCTSFASAVLLGVILVMKFQVYAGNMYCGELVVASFGHIFVNRNGILSDAIYSYKQLNLQRIK